MADAQLRFEDDPVASSNAGHHSVFSLFRDEFDRDFHQVSSDERIRLVSQWATSHEIGDQLALSLRLNGVDFEAGESVRAADATRAS